MKLKSIAVAIKKYFPKKVIAIEINCSGHKKILSKKTESTIFFYILKDKVSKKVGFIMSLILKIPVFGLRNSHIF